MTSDIKNLSLGGFQVMIERIYGRVNNRNFDTSDFVSRIHRDITRILKSVRQKRMSETRHQMCMAFSWSLALANRLDIDLDYELWRQYPGVCPYCKTSPCSCTQKRAKERQVVKAKSRVIRPTTFRDYQKMLREIYPDNTLKDSAIHLAEEAGEVDEAIALFRGTHESAMFEEVKIELVDVVANLCGVASCSRIDLAAEMALQFDHGCPNCRCNGCKCTFVTSAHSRP